MLTRALVSVLAAGLAAVLVLAAGQQAARTAAGGGAAGGCQGTVNKTFGCVPAGCQVTVQALACPIGAAAAGAPAGAGAAPPAPAVLAALPRQTLGLPSPVIRSSPAQKRPAAHELADLAVDQPGGVGAGVEDGDGAGESVTATATPVSVTRRRNGSPERRGPSAETTSTGSATDAGQSAGEPAAGAADASQPAPAPR